jgi:diacylglycerol kinase (ATP)
MTDKKPHGFARIIHATHYSMQGLWAAWKTEAAFRQEAGLAMILLPLGAFLGDTGVEKALLTTTPLGVMVVELLNSALEAALDRTGTQYHPLAGKAKDMGSAAVFISLVMTALVWSWIILE